jgi:hypothetical protein
LFFENMDVVIVITNVLDEILFIRVVELRRARKCLI